MTKNKTLIALSLVLGASAFNSFTLGTIKGELENIKHEKTLIDLKVVNSLEKLITINDTYAAIIDELVTSSETTLKDLTKSYAVDKKAVEDRVISTLKSDYECPNEHFKDICLILSNYHGVY